MRRSIKDLLVDAKDVSELMVDLAYAAVVYDDREIAREVLELEDHMNSAVYELRELCLLAARSPEDAESFAGILQVATAMEKMGDAAEDIARVVLKRLGVPFGLRQDLKHADEVIGRVPLPEGSPLAGRSLVELAIPRETGLWVIAVKRGLEWVFGPDRDVVVADGDILYVQGAEEGVAALRRHLGLGEDPPEAEEWGPTDNLDYAVDLLVEMKNVSEVAVGLAYSALILRDKGLVAEVRSLEDRTDEMHDELESWVLAAGRTELDPSDLRGLLHIGSASERIADAAQEIVWVIERDEELHPVVTEALAEADEVVAEFFVTPGASAAGRTIGESRILTDTGMYVLAVQRGRVWRYRPRRQFRLEEGDRILAIGPEDGIGLLAGLTGNGRGVA